MREDMLHVVNEIHSHDGSNARHKLYDDLEDAPTKESMRRSYKDYKYQCGRFTPIFRYLEKQVGKLWDKVWSQICKRFDARSSNGSRARGLVLSYVDSRDMRSLRGFWYMGWGFYLDEDRILRKYPPRKRSPYRQVAEFIEIDGRLLRQERGIWYFVEPYKKYVDEKQMRYSYVTKSYETVSRLVLKTLYRKVKQLNKKELRDYGVKNQHVA